MALFQRRRGSEPAPVTTNGATREPQRANESAYFDLKTRIHRQLIERLDLTKLALLPHDAVQQQIQRIVEDMLASDETPLSRQEREQLVVEVQHETFGLGPIEPLMQDPTVSDILVNGPRAVYVERRGRLERTRVIFRDDTHLLQVIERIVSAVGRRVDESSPMVDARLPDGSRVNAIIPPLALDGPVLSIRRFAVDPLKTEDLLELGTWTPAPFRDHPGRGQGPPEHPDLGRNRLREDHPPQRHLGGHPEPRAHRHRGGLGRAPAPAGAQGPPRDASGQRRGRRDRHPARPRAQRAPDAARPDHPR